MKSGKLGFFVVLLLLSSSTCLAWFGSSSSKHKISSSSANGRNSILSYEQPSSSSSSPSFLNRFRSGSSVVFPVHGNVYPVGYVKGTSFFYILFDFFFFFLFPSVSLYAFLSPMLLSSCLFLFGPPCFVLLFYSSKSNLNNKTSS